MIQTSMHFTRREEAGRLLAHKLLQYQNTESIVYGLPRGGVVVAAEVAKILHAPLDVIVTRKIGSPNNPEFSIAAVNEHKDLIGNERYLARVDRTWLTEKLEEEKEELERRKALYVPKVSTPDARNKIAILVDDGIATGFTIRAAIKELRHRKVKKIVVATPVILNIAVDTITQEADELVALIINGENALSSYYDDFLPVSDETVIKLLQQ